MYVTISKQNKLSILLSENMELNESVVKYNIHHNS